jgi:signal transduction histidine kinase
MPDTASNPAGDAGHAGLLARLRHVRLRLPRRSLRLRLTGLYSALFLVCGAALLAITYALVARSDGQSLSVTLKNGQVADHSEQPFSTLGLSKQVGQLLQAQRADELRVLLTESGVALLIMALASVVLGWWIAGRALRPVRQMTGKARRISEVNLHERLRVVGPEDELKELGDTFDGLLARLEAAFEAQRRFVANASHELRTPLTYQRALIEVSLADPGADTAQLRDVCKRLLDAGGEQERLIEALLTLARSQRGLERREPVDLAAAVGQEIANRRSAGLPAPRIDPTLGPAWLAGDRQLVGRLVANLLDNALKYNEPDGWVAIQTGTADGRALVRIANSGPVVPTGRVDALFEPFQRLHERTARRREGLGLGLSIVAAIAGVHGAHLTAEALPAGGLNVTAVFPPPQTAQPTRSAQYRPASSGL